MAGSINNVRLIVTDVDGVWTDGRIIYMGDQREIKEFHVRDGLAVKLAQKSGLELAVVTSRSSKALERRCHELGIREVRQGESDKLQAVNRMLHSRKLTFENLCYIGDDLPDLSVIGVAALTAAPSDAAPEVIAAVDWRLGAPGGGGAIRELVERLLKERGEWEAIVRSFHEAKVTASSI